MTLDDDGADPEDGATKRADADREVRESSRERLRDAARELLARATLDDLTAFVTVRRLSEHAGLSSGAVYSAYEPEHATGSRTRSAPQVVARLAFGDQEPSSHQRSLRRRAELIDMLRNADRHDGAGVLEVFAEGFSSIIVSLARCADDDDGWSFTQVFLGAAVSPHDTAITEYMQRNLERRDGFMLAALTELLEVSGREPVDGIDLVDLARILVSATIGGAMRIRVDPTLDPEFIARTCLTVLASLTRRGDERDRRFGHHLTDDRSALSESERLAVRDAVRRVNSRAGWGAVTLAKVGQLADISDARMAAAYRSRDALATLAWEDVVAGMERRAAAHAARPAADRIQAFVEDLADVVCAHRSLVASLLVDRLERVAPGVEREVDAGTGHLVSHLGALLAGVGAESGDGSALRGPHRVGDGDGHERMARSLLDAVFMRAASSSAPGEEIAARVQGWLIAAAAETP